MKEIATKLVEGLAVLVAILICLAILGGAILGVDRTARRNFMGMVGLEAATPPPVTPLPEPELPENCSADFALPPLEVVRLDLLQNLGLPAQALIEDTYFYFEGELYYTAVLDDGTFLMMSLIATCSNEDGSYYSYYGHLEIASPDG